MKPPLTLGQLIKALSKYDPAKYIRYDFGPFTPDTLKSYRGYYDQIALGYGEESITVGEILKRCKKTVGHIFTGYKGGDYEMTEDTPVWMANWGEYNSTAIIGVMDNGYNVILETAFIP
jgi:hypothetical protein